MSKKLSPGSSFSSRARVLPFHLCNFVRLVRHVLVLVARTAFRILSSFGPICFLTLTVQMSYVVWSFSRSRANYYPLLNLHQYKSFLLLFHPLHRPLGFRSRDNLRNAIFLTRAGWDGASHTEEGGGVCGHRKGEKRQKGQESAHQERCELERTARFQMHTWYESVRFNSWTSTPLLALSRCDKLIGSST